jgi:hypothetical protein
MSVITSPIGSQGDSQVSALNTVGAQGPVILDLQTYIGQGRMKGKLVLADGMDVVLAVPLDHRTLAQELVNGYFEAQTRPASETGVDTYTPSNGSSGGTNGAGNTKTSAG